MVNYIPYLNLKMKMCYYYCLKYIYILGIVSAGTKSKDILMCTIGVFLMATNCLTAAKCVCVGRPVCCPPAGRPDCHSIIPVSPTPTHLSAHPTLLITVTRTWRENMSDRDKWRGTDGRRFIMRSACHYAPSLCPFARSIWGELRDGPLTCPLYITCRFIRVRGTCETHDFVASNVW